MDLWSTVLRANLFEDLGSSASSSPETLSGGLPYITGRVTLRLSLRTPIRFAEELGSAVASLSSVITDVLPVSASIYTAELHALRIALEHISLSRGKMLIIYTDSLSALQSSVSLHSSSHPILVDITYALANHLKKKDIRFCWIRGHAGITGNELADTAARSATGSSERFPIPHSDLKACFRLKLQSVWQSNWDQQIENKLHSIMPVLAPTAPSLSNRREQVIWSRLRLGHTHPLRIGISCWVNHHPIARNVMSHYR
ncbi:uncharacterized protein TNCV_1445221 [Trichonephila clavipes]|nr:uncharacterized protein TNCV_1445221 [Trichonephila clavipes]